MYLAVRYAKRKFKEYQDGKATQQDGNDSHPVSTEMGQYGDKAMRAPIPSTVNNHHRTSSSNSNTPRSSSTASILPASTHVTARLQTIEHNTTKAEKNHRRTYRLKLILGLTLPFTLQALDATIIAPAMLPIASAFRQQSQLNWIVSSFHLTSAAFLPLWAQLVDTFGRSPALHASILTMAVGSALCTAAPTSSGSAGFGVLLLGRAIQGVGCAGVNICVRTILADRVGLGEHARNWGVFVMFAAVGYALGPVAGGYMVSASWRWCFAVNLPVAVVAMGLAGWVFRGEWALVGAVRLDGVEGSGKGRGDVEGGGGGRVSRGGGVVVSRYRKFLRRLSTIDYPGQLLFLLGLGLLVLSLTWAGGMYAWSSPAVIIPLTLGLILSIAWLLYERALATIPSHPIITKLLPRNQKPMMPWRLITHRDIGLLFLINFSMGAAMFAVMYFLEIYFVRVRCLNPSQAGLALLWFLPGLAVGTYSATLFTNVIPGIRQTFPPLLLGSITAAVGITVLAWATSVGDIKQSVVYGMMALTGHGVGMSFNPGTLHGLAYFPDMAASVACLVSFAQPFGGTVGLTVMMTVFNNRGPGGVGGSVGHGAEGGEELGKCEVGDEHSRATALGIMWAFIALIPLVWLTMFATTWLGNVWILKDGGHEVVHGPWFWSVVTGRRLMKEKMELKEWTEDVGVDDAHSDTAAVADHRHAQKGLRHGGVNRDDVEASEPRAK